MGISAQTVREGLKRGVFDFGYAVQMPSGRHVYYISPEKFNEKTGAGGDAI